MWNSILKILQGPLVIDPMAWHRLHSCHVHNKSFMQNKNLSWQNNCPKGNHLWTFLGLQFWPLKITAVTTSR